MKNTFLYLLVACCLFSCERDETILIPDDNAFCPIHFKYRPEVFVGLGSCSFSFADMRAEFTRDEDPGVLMAQKLYQRSRPFIAAFEADSTQYKALHLTTTNSVHQFSFDKIEMVPGTRVSLYLGATRFISQEAGYWMGNIQGQSPLGPSPLHRWQVFLQREMDGTYSFGYVAAGQRNTVHAGIPDFEKASFDISNGVGRSIITAALWPVGGGQPQWYINTSNLNLPPFEENLYAAFGLDMLEALHADCEARNVKLRLRQYSYFNGDPSDTLGDDFACNTIIK